MKLKITNNTHFQTKDLKKVMKECMKHEGINKCGCAVNYSKSGRIHGYAYLNSTTVIMFIPKTKLVAIAGSDGTTVQRRENFTFTQGAVERFAQIFTHELHHNLGLHHKEMKPSWKINCEWAKGYPIFIKEDKPKPKRNLKKERYEKALTKVKQYQTRLKKTNTILKKWQKKVRYYENGMETESIFII